MTGDASRMLQRVAREGKHLDDSREIDTARNRQAYPETRQRHRARAGDGAADTREPVRRYRSVGDPPERAHGGARGEAGRAYATEGKVGQGARSSVASMAMSCASPR